MQYEIEINGRVRRAAVHRVGGTFSVEIDGRRWSVDAERLDGQSMSLLIDETAGLQAVTGETAREASRDAVEAGGRRSVSHDVIVAADGSSGQLAVRVGARSVTVSLNGRRRGARRGDGSHAAGGLQRVVAPMPGKIVRVLVSQGDAVRARQPIVVIEAMKMENELRASRDGLVTEIHAREGQSVEASELLAVIAPDSK